MSLVDDFKLVYETATGDDGGSEGGTALPGMHREDSQDCVQDQRWDCLVVFLSLSITRFVVLVFVVDGFCNNDGAGVQEMSIDKEKETVTVKGSMDVKALVESLKERLKRKVEVVPPKKEKEKDKDKDKDKDKEKEKEKEKEGGGEKGGGGGKGGGKKKAGGDNKKAEEETGGGEGGGKLEQSKMEFMGAPYGYGYGYGYNYGPVYYMEPVHPPQMFSDENPNACSIMWDLRVTKKQGMITIITLVHSFFFFILYLFCRVWILIEIFCG